MLKEGTDKFTNVMFFWYRTGSDEHFKISSSLAIVTRLLDVYN